MSVPESPLDDQERAEFYRSPRSEPAPPEPTQPELDDDDEYELEPIDESVPTAEQLHARNALERAAEAFDIDAAYDDEQLARDQAIGELWSQVPRQFKIRHLMMATALLAILLALRSIFSSFGAIFLAGTAAVAAALYLIKRKEEQLAAELAERRRAFNEAQRLAKQGQDGPPPKSPPPRADKPGTADLFPALDDFEFKFSYSLKQVMIAITGAAVLLGILNWLGGPTVVAFLFGLLALAGPAALLVGYAPPANVAFVWWLILGLYVASNLVLMVIG